MKILACTQYYYYDDLRGVEPQFYYLYRVPKAMGHDVDFFDWRTLCRIDVEQMRSQFLRLLNGGGYDAVFIATSMDEFDPDTLREAQRFCPVIAFNSDDEDRWKDYSRPRADWYTFLVTNSRDVYESHRGEIPNLLHAQWACCGFWDGRRTRKDIDFSFVGQIYGQRAAQTESLRRTAQLRSYGKGLTPSVRAVAPNASAWKVAMGQMLTNALHKRLPDIFRSSTISFEEVNQYWNRSRISFTPLESSRNSEVYQIKSRVFDMGLSGTLMIAPRAAAIELYYEPGKEYVPYDDLKDCADKVRFYLSHERERNTIAMAYAARTEAEHMWHHRMSHVFRHTGLLP
jgi:hypothetical protein